MSKAILLSAIVALTGCAVGISEDAERLFADVAEPITELPDVQGCVWNPTTDITCPPWMFLAYCPPIMRAPEGCLSENFEGVPICCP